jgi:C-terminal processing protease CtpA/Prc
MLQDSENSAEDAGLKKGDIITKVDNTTLQILQIFPCHRKQTSW